MTNRRLVGVCALAFGMRWVDPVAASTITFDDLTVTPTGNGAAQPFSTLVLDGFEFTAPQFHIVANPSLCGLGGCVSNGTQYAVSDAPGGTIAHPTGGPITMKRTSGDTFTLTAFDGAEAVLNIGSAAFSIRVVGHQFGGATLSTDFVLDLVRDGDGGAPDFQTLQFDPGWTQLISVEWSGFHGVLPNAMAFDNIEVAADAVPEPTTIVLISTGLLGATRRRARQRQQRQ